MIRDKIGCRIMRICDGRVQFQASNPVKGGVASERIWGYPNEDATQ